ncbi:MAG: GFA family protein [Burkholderiales bacterium]
MSNSPVPPTPEEAQGGCLCGAVRYRARTAAARTMVCHCRACQKQSGSAFSVSLVVARDAIDVTGATSVFEQPGDSGQAVQRHFCGQCGSPVINTLSARPGVVVVRAGTLDDPTWLAPRVHIWCDNAQPWVAIPDADTRFARAPG